MDTSGNVKVVPAVAENGAEISHAVIFEGAEIAVAGEIRLTVDQGDILISELSNFSGHYTPEPGKLHWFISQLQDLNIYVDPNVVTFYGWD